MDQIPITFAGALERAYDMGIDLDPGCDLKTCGLDVLLKVRYLVCGPEIGI